MKLSASFEVAIVGVTVLDLPMFAAQYPTLLRASTGLDLDSCRG